MVRGPLSHERREQRLMGGGPASHGRRTIFSWEEDYLLMGGGPASHGRRSIVSREEDRRLKGGGPASHWKGCLKCPKESVFVSKEKCQRSLGEEELENYFNGVMSNCVMISVGELNWRIIM